MWNTQIQIKIRNAIHYRCDTLEAGIQSSYSLLDIASRLRY